MAREKAPVAVAMEEDEPLTPEEIEAITGVQQIFAAKVELARVAVETFGPGHGGDLKSFADVVAQFSNGVVDGLLGK